MQMMGLAADDMMDEWEWPANCKAQREMENHLRCQICGDFFHGPVLLPCSHTFCSACVRRFMQSKGTNACCPQCKQPCASRDLVPNRALEQVALLFEKSKPELLKRLQGGASAPSSANSTPNTESGKTRGKSKAKQDKPERMPLVSYSVMRDKEVRKLLDSINVRVPTKNRDEIIQIHKEVGTAVSSDGSVLHVRYLDLFADFLVGCTWLGRLFLFGFICCRYSVCTVVRAAVERSSRLGHPEEHESAT